MTWQKENLKMCIKSKNYFVDAKKKLICRRKTIGYENINYEILNKKPVILKISRFLNQNSMKNIENYFEKFGYYYLFKYKLC